MQEFNHGGISLMLKGILFIFLAFTGGCSIVSDMTVREEVKPWEKDVLAQEDMQIPADPMHAFTDDHIYFSKEASSGGNGVGGGGCGCN
jgi:hypothetical protein